MDECVVRDAVWLAKGGRAWLHMWVGRCGPLRLMQAHCRRSVTFHATRPSPSPSWSAYPPAHRERDREKHTHTQREREKQTHTHTHIHTQTHAHTYIETYSNTYPRIHPYMHKQRGALLPVRPRDHGLCRTYKLTCLRGTELSWYGRPAGVVREWRGFD
jgi:hypothetical protein